MPRADLRDRRTRAVAIALGATLASGLALAPHPAQAHDRAASHDLSGSALLSHCEGDSPIVCTFPGLDVGDYDVTVVLGDGDEATDTEVFAESRRLMLESVVADAGEFERRSFTVNVRDPEGQQNQPVGTGDPGLTLTFSGTTPGIERITITPASRRTQLIALVGDSTVTDQETWPYTGWGQRLPAYFDRGVSVVNHSGSGESTVSQLEKPEMFDALETRLRRGDVVLIQLAHNDKTTTAEQYRANLGEMIDRVRARGATPVLVTPIVRHRFENGQLTPTGLIVTDLADLPAEMRRVADEKEVPLIDLTARSEELVESLGPVDSEPIYLVRINGDRTHTSEYGASVYAGVVAEELRGLGLVDERGWRGVQRP